MSKDTSVSPHSGNTTLPHNAETTLEHVLDIMSELVRWLVISGVGYTEFSTALKKTFYNEALRELDRIQQKKTDSAISLLSGLNRRDIRQFCQINGEYQPFEHNNTPLPVSVPARVVSLWINQNLPHRIPVNGEENSFESLVKQISSEKHPKSILLELKRLGIIHEDDEHVILHVNSFTPNPELDESKQLFTHNISAHLAAGVHNLTTQSNFLEQAVFADHLSQESIDKLRHLSADLWNIMSKAVIAAALDYCEQDKTSPEVGKQFRLGIYQYDQD